MDPFAEPHSDLTGSLISIEFNESGRISQLWATDPALPEEGEEFQFILPPLSFGEESAEDYYPGTILLGGRADPDSPWILGRNSFAAPIFQSDDEEGSFSSASFEYAFPLLPEIHVTGKYYEIPGVLPQIVWDLELANQSKYPMEIGELAFPLAFNNYYEGFGWTNEQLQSLWKSRVYIHPFIGGAASWLFVQRMNSAPPGLLIFPGEKTSWEFFAHVPASLMTNFQWGGIPVVYVYSKAVAEREGWDSSLYEHTSLILQPGESKKFQMRFVPTEQGEQDRVFEALVACRRPSIHLLPSAVAPCEVGIAVEISGTTPTQFYTDNEAELETDSDENGGFCFVKPKNPGPLKLTFEDTRGEQSYVHLLFTDPIEQLIQKRAEWVMDKQVLRNPKLLFDQTIIPGNLKTQKSHKNPEFFSAAEIESSLADALFLAEKNSIYPDSDQIKILDHYIDDFLLNKIQNPGDMSVSSTLKENGLIPAYPGRLMTYPYVFNLYHAMYKVALITDQTARKPLDYLKFSWATGMAMFQFGWRRDVWTSGVVGYSRIYEILADLSKEDLRIEFDQLLSNVYQKAKNMVQQDYPYTVELALDATAFSEAFFAAKYLEEEEHQERTIRCAYAARSLAPSWWWYGSDTRIPYQNDSVPIGSLKDKGEICLSYTTIPNSLIFFEYLDRDYFSLPETYMRSAFGGMLGPWALVHHNGAASMCYCPDRYSWQYGFNFYSGQGGMGYFHYLRQVGSYVLPGKDLSDVYSFGCHFEQHENYYQITPWDGVGRKIILRQISAEFYLSFGKIEELKLDVQKRWFKIKIFNPSHEDVHVKFSVAGLWGSKLELEERLVENSNGVITASLILSARKITEVYGKVVL